MSRENVESVRRGIDAWNRGDEWLAGFAPEAELHTTGRSRIGASIGGVLGWSATGRNSERTSRS